MRINVPSNYENELIREHFNKDGQPKKQYPSRSAAEFNGAYYDQEPYECGFCGKWHLAKKKEQ
jgi:hypothetical protein